MSSIQITVNGRPHAMDADPDTPLLWVLRDHLGLTGTKYGCGLGVCGACTVLEGGTAARSCQIPLSEAAGRSFTTVEGLAGSGTHAVQRAWLEEDVAQCGYCQPGMLLCAASLLRRSARPSDAEIDAAFEEMVCRCGTYPRIRRAVHRAAALGGGAR